MFLSKRMRVTFCALTMVLSMHEPTQASQLPDGVTLPDGVELPDNFKLPDGIEIPEGFEITEDMVQQYLKYLEDSEDSEKEIGGDQWFKQLANEHPNANLQMNVKKVDTASANEQAEFNDKFLDTFMNKEVILPTIGVILAIVAIWAFMTKCGKRKCCKDSKKQNSDQLETRKSVKSSSEHGQSEQPRSSSDDIENYNQQNNTNLASEKSSSSLGGAATIHNK